MSALFSMPDLLTVILLLICVCTYVRGYRKGIFDVEDGSHSGLRGLCWKAARVGERLSPYVSAALLVMAGRVLMDS
ncbi:conserved unknown protein [Ectocarpus siliculosus]|uniref:Protein kish n=1 Tax=Ectocarpus siliculosus TaxID=2880 RepID=D7G6V7_ECTSI|nr:unnamed protein product [Ectocarpus sp. CCAP 1310/34]CBJ25650.1 conserved unknown protein [Ectocarpus siliculosus]|eukprot:CBJ25650.1 conserved unknown protein [Ectocarpus siliculosus]